ncbi:MAG TPA: ATP-binding cassette domain-containing protein [Beijerinckiaceae bacterium]|nr:ATP-binding cassette domain-containing protein [Beijerinckiaceae bacterium]
MLRMRNVRVTLGGFAVLRDVDLALAPGRTTLLVGRNGAGKTTTLRAIMGLLPIAAGELAFGDTDLRRAKPRERAALGIGYAPEDRRLIPDFTVEDNLLLPAVALRLDAAARRERLEGVYALLPELHALRTRLGGHLSGGQGKMVALGRALMAGTRLVLLDEPFQGLAPALARSYAETLARIRSERRDLTLLVTESSPQLLEGLVDAALQIERGHIAEADLASLRH